ncbi:MAG: glycosyltransferase family 2 protein [Candidatus Moranbacteria bacterium]|nr:glycosyltransferase family 2 protein [Candidatus Moranbacteria bacterium]
MSKKISVVIPVYNEEKNVSLVSQEVAAVFSSLPYEYEIIFVNDGSRDNSLLEILRLGEADSRIKGLDFSRNFGKEPALSAGCHIASGDAVITMDADLQHPAELISELLKEWEKGAEVVYTVRKKNEGASLMKRLTSSAYYWLFNKITSVTTEPRSTDFRLLDKKVIEVFRKFPERERMFRGMVDWMGYKRSRVEFVARERKYGQAGYSYAKLFGLAINSFTSFSLLPLKIAGYLGVVITACSGLLLIVMFAAQFFKDWLVFTPLSILATINIFLVGIVLVSLGFVALYIARIHSEVINRPLYIVREKVNFDAESVIN